MSTRIKYSLINKVIFFIFIFFFSALNAYASNALSGVDVKQLNNDNYNVILKVNDSVNIKKISDSKDNLTLVLNSVVPADSLEIVYDNASELNNVIVQKKNDNNTLILLQGKNIENAGIYTKELSTGLVKKYDSDINSLDTYLYIANTKYLIFGISGVIVLFLLMLSFRPKSKKYVSPSVNKQQKTRKYAAGNTIRNRAAVRNGYVPSINYKVSNSKLNMSVPKDFVISDSQNYEEEIRKAG